MQKMYETYQDIAEFRIVYIKEAHPADGSWPVPYAKEKGITQHTSYGQRCDVAKKLLDDNKLTIPTVIDNMENQVNKDYSAWPDRVFLVRKDGTLGVAAGRGPWGFKPAIDAVKSWLVEYKKTGKEPAIAESQASAAPDGGASAKTVADKKFPATANAKIAVGAWTMNTSLGDRKIPADMVLSVKDGSLAGVWKSMGREMTLLNVKLDGDKLSFDREMAPGRTLHFEGTVQGAAIDGKYTGPFGELTCTGQRAVAVKTVDESGAGSDGD